MCMQRDLKRKRRRVGGWIEYTLKKFRYIYVNDRYDRLECV